MFKLEIKGLEKLKQLQRDLIEAAKFDVNLTRAKDDIDKIISEQNRKVFATGTGPDGSVWPARKRARSNPLLDDTGQLKKSRLSPLSRLEDNGRKIITTFSGPNAFLARIHSQAKGTKQKGLERRQVEGLSEESREKINKIAFERIADNFAVRLKMKRKR